MKQTVEHPLQLLLPDCLPGRQRVMYTLQQAILLSSPSDQIIASCLSIKLAS
jgi:hypothetical protein